MQPQWGQRSFYEQWMEQEGLPITEEVAGIEDITEVPRGPWARLGGYGAFLQLEGTIQAGKGMYVAEIPAGGALNPEKHLYDELIYILRGRGLTEVWQGDGPKRSFEWGEGSLFAVPMNAWHRLANGGREPVLFFAVTSAPHIMQSFRNNEFVFNCDYTFSDRYQGQPNYFAVGENRVKQGFSTRWETNFVPDVRTAMLDDLFQKVSGGQLTQFRMASWTTVHSSEWPAGRYHKAHYHGPGAVLLGLKSEGYVLIWPKDAGTRPYQAGRGDEVMKVNWKPGSIYSPPNEWFHQHFNTGREQARHLAVTGGGGGFRPRTQVEQAVYVSVDEGGWLIEYEDEDPEIRRRFAEAVRQNGVEFAMPVVVYR